MTDKKTTETVNEVVPVKPSEGIEQAQVKQGVLDKIEAKKDEAKAIEVASDELAAENNIPDLDVVSKGEKILSAIGYLSFLCILPLVLKEKSEFCQVHGKQGLILVILWLISMPIRFVGDLIMDGWFSGIVGFMYFLVICYGIYSVFKGKKELPVLGMIAKKLSW
ncbi:hypothetical protein KAI58_00755 [Candidatus Gracilibacteria bacterium]|nr:hypothetical protein [Candidatus Gracilibacteria bacterium]